VDDAVLEAVAAAHDVADRVDQRGHGLVHRGAREEAPRLRLPARREVPGVVEGPRQGAGQQPEPSSASAVETGRRSRE
jgi:hypothetical protein